MSTPAGADNRTGTIAVPAFSLVLELPLTKRVHGLFTDLAVSGGELLDHSALYLQLERQRGE